MSKNLFKKLIVSIFIITLFNFKICLPNKISTFFSAAWEAITTSNTWKTIDRWTNPQTMPLLQPTPIPIPSNSWSTRWQNYLLERRLNKAYNHLIKSSQTKFLNVIKQSIQTVSEINSHIKTNNNTLKFWNPQSTIQSNIAENGITTWKELKYAHKLTKLTNSPHFTSLQRSLGQFKHSKHLKNLLYELAKYRAQHGNIPIFKEIFKFIIRESAFLFCPEKPILRLALILGSLCYIFITIKNYIKNRNIDDTQQKITLLKKIKQIIFVPLYDVQQKTTLLKTIARIIFVPLTAGFILQNINPIRRNVLNWL